MSERVVAISVALLVTLGGACAHPHAGSEIISGAIPPDRVAILPSLDSLLPASVRSDSAAILALVVGAENGEPLPAQVHVGKPSAAFPSESPDGWTVLNPGQLFARRYAPGTYQVTVRVIGFHLAQRKIDLQAGEVDTLLVRMRPAPYRFAP